MYWIVYKTTCLVNNKIYIGVHKVKDRTLLEAENYIGNGISNWHTYSIRFPKFPFHYAVAKYGIENFKREILKEFDNEDLAYKMEEDLVTEDFIKLDSNYNFTVGGKCCKKLCRVIYQFDLDGNLVNYYKSIEEASKNTGISESAIATSAREKKSRRGYIWAYTDDIDIDDYYIKRLCKYYIYDSSGCFVKEFDKLSSLKEELNTCSANINRAIKRRIKVKGFYISKTKEEKFIK